ncbi:Hypothetical protein NTJ_03453 [Nesidiocoris tenuis]|uniref:Uncharacterized protein n=1 Tax=Nesidiocoris tenuis TaxID=355587 RepID=A0ABN7AIE6_9HEMI|nr:Hypothetical protein NTJ_03453 [Nesidiocoris tenuis]
MSSVRLVRRGGRPTCHVRSPPGGKAREAIVIPSAPARGAAAAFPLPRTTAPSSPGYLHLQFHRRHRVLHIASPPPPPPLIHSDPDPPHRRPTPPLPPTPQATNCALE